MMLDRDKLLRAYPQIPDRVDRRMDETLIEIRQQAAQPSLKRRSARLRLAAVFAAAFLLLTAIGVAAGVRFGVFDFMEQLFGQTDLLPQANELVQNELAVKETAHVTITLSQAVYDGGNLRLVYSVRVKGATAPLTQEEWNHPDSDFHKALAMDGVSPWGCDWFLVDGVEYTMTGGSADAAIPGAENGEALCYMDICLASAGIVPQDDFKVSLPIIRSNTGERETLDFTVKAGANTFKPLIRQANDATITVESVFLSPVRSYVNLHIQIGDGVSAQRGDVLLADWRDALLTDAQGREIAKCCDVQTLAEIKGVSARYSYTFLPTDADEVFIAPTVIDESNRWYADMAQAIRLKPMLEE